MSPEKNKKVLAASKIAASRKGQTTRRRINKSNGTHVNINGRTRMVKSLSSFASSHDRPVWFFLDEHGKLQRTYLPEENLGYLHDAHHGLPISAYRLGVSEAVAGKPRRLG